MAPRRPLSAPSSRGLSRLDGSTGPTPSPSLLGSGTCPVHALERVSTPYPENVHGFLHSSQRVTEHLPPRDPRFCNVSPRFQGLVALKFSSFETHGLTTFCPYLFPCSCFLSASIVVDGFGRFVDRVCALVMRAYENGTASRPRSSSFRHTNNSARTGHRSRMSFRDVSHSGSAGRPAYLVDRATSGPDRTVCPRLCGAGLGGSAPGPELGRGGDRGATPRSLFSPQPCVKLLVLPVYRRVSVDVLREMAAGMEGRWCVRCGDAPAVVERSLELRSLSPFSRRARARRLSPSCARRHRRRACPPRFCTCGQWHCIGALR